MGETMIHLSSPWWWLVFLLFLLTLRGLCSLSLRIAKQRSMSIDALKEIHERKKAVNRLTKFGVISIAIFGAGYYAGLTEYQRQRYTYTDVLIVARHSPTNFDVQPARMPAWAADDLCDSEDWQQWQKMKRFTFSVKTLPNGTRCKDAEIGGAYEFYMQDGKRLLYPQETISSARY